jgi:hypothetical protein
MAQITEGAFRGMAVFQGKTGLPRDRYVNTFHFTRGGGWVPGTIADPADFGSFRDEIGERLREFYCEATAGGGRVGELLSPYIERDFEIRVYDLSNDGPAGGQRTAGITTHTLPAAVSASSLPLEVAITASFYAGTNTPRRRGRIFLGPLGEGALGAQAEFPTVAEGWRTTLAEAMTRLANEGAGDASVWGVFSPKDNEVRPVTGGWVDNDFDTIRARGPRATSRSSWAA